MATYEEIMIELERLYNPEAARGMARFGICLNNTFGISTPNLRRIAKNIGKDHLLAQNLWGSGIHEARILAAFIDNPYLVTENQMDNWVEDFDSWDVCDQVCNNLFRKTKFAHSKAFEWSYREKEFIIRAGFVLMASLAVHDKNTNDSKFIDFLDIIMEMAEDERNYVKKAINWALRQIGKRNFHLNNAAISCAMEIQKKGSKSAKWIAKDALRELTSDKIQSRLSAKVRIII
jgi:3-methyladenine DNA glycosylase AlkD